MPKFITDNLALIVMVGIVLVGLLGIGLKDVLRFSITRSWAISSVCFRQSIRRRVLWLTPLVIIGVLTISQLQKPIDPQDAVRQTTSYCLFATGLLVAIVTIILACTNLPQEIENRVIYTVATKPTTRLEIVVGKVIGFVRVSFLILLIMGIFTWGYLRFRDWRMRGYVAAQLAEPNVDPISKPTLEYYKQHGTLHARELVLPERLALYSHEPTNPQDRWAAGGTEGEMLVAFELDRSLVPPPGPEQRSAMGPGLVGASSDIQLILKVRNQPAADPTAPAPTTLPTTNPTAGRGVPSVMVDFRDLNMNSVFTSDLLTLPPGQEKDLQVSISYEQLEKLLPPSGPALVWVVVMGMGEGYEYSTSSGSMRFIMPPATVATAFTEVLFAGRVGQYGQQLKGGAQRVAVFEFRDKALPAARNGVYPFELRAGIEQARNEEAAEEDYATKVVLTFHNRSIAGSSFTQEISPESNRPTYFDVPDRYVSGGHFDVVVRMRTAGWIGMRPGELATLKLVRNDQGFAWNLLKSLAVLWLMSLLVTIISIFCSTFLSWPIAVVLTLVILFGRWGVNQLGDVAQPGFGRRVAEDMFKDSNAATTRTVSESVEALVKMMNLVSSVLPDVSQFAALEHIQQGVAVPPATLLASLQVALGFGIPLLVLAYVFLKYKEVAP
jgi:ABC-type transport system involved in multi-copper enzyme maturation permease subunit